MCLRVCTFAAYVHSSSKVDMKLWRSVKGKAPQEEWHNTCAHTHIYSTHKYTSSPFFSSLYSMTHPTQGQRVREEEDRGECEGRKSYFTDSQRRHMALSIFLLTFLFQCYANPIGGKVICSRLFPANTRYDPPQSHVKSRRWFPRPFLLVSKRFSFFASRWNNSNPL